MSNTKELFDTIDRYMRIRADAREEYMLMERRYEKAKGSPYYTEQMSAARKKRTQTMEEAQAAARAEVKRILEDMCEQAKKISLQPPTQDMLNLLQMLKIKENITQADLDGASNAMNGNGLGLAILDEMAAEHNKKDPLHIIMPVYFQKATAGLSTQQALEAIRSVGENCYDIIKNDHGANRVSAYISELHAKRWGGTVNYDELPQEPFFEDVTDFIEHVSPVGYDIFSKAVDSPLHL